MADCRKPVVNDGAALLLALIKQLIKEKQYEGVALLFASDKEAERNLQYLPAIAMDLYHDVCLKNLNDKNYNKEATLYNCAEELLKVVASHAPAEVLLLELLELVEECKSEHVFTSALKALQSVLLRQGCEKPRALEWSLNSVCTHLVDLPVPKYLNDGYDAKQQQLLEQDNNIQKLLMHYITVGLFYNPLISVTCSLPRRNKEIFRPMGATSRNVLCCFLINLLGKPLSLLDLSNDGRKTNTYSLQCAVSLTTGATKCILDPLLFLSLVESRTRFKISKEEDDSLSEISSCNIFLNNEKLPLNCLAIYYYMIFVEGVDAERLPLVYHPIYILESCLYLIYELLQQEEPPLHEKALLLMQKLLNNLRNQHLIAAASLELEIQKSICLTLCNLIGYSAHTQLRQLGLKVLRQYIICFEDEGKFLIIKNLLKYVQHNGITGYLIVLYKDLVAEALDADVELPTYFCGHDFRHLLLRNVCELPRGIETDLLENSDKIVSSLNVLRYFALRDTENLTGFWNFTADIEATYLAPLRKALYLSVAHFKAELHNVESGVECPQLMQLNLLNIDVANDKNPKLDFNIDREKKICILNKNLSLFDLMQSLLSRVCECLENAPECIKSKISQQQ